MKAQVGAFNQETALVGAFSVIVQPVVEPMDRFTALLRTGDLVISVGDEECLESTAAQLRNTIRRLDSRATVTMTVGRRTQQ